MSTKSSSSKFWKKFGLGKKASSPQDNSRPPSILSHATNNAVTPTTKEDTHSIRNKRFSGVFPNRKQSTSSMNRLHYSSITDQDITMNTPPLPSGSVTDMEPLSTTPPSSQTTVKCQGEPSFKINHVESSTPPSDSDLDIDFAFDVITHDEAQVDSPTKDSNLTTTAPVTTPVTTPTIINNNTNDNTMTPTPTPKRSIEPKNISSLKKIASQSPKEITKSRLRQPSRPSSTISHSITPSTSTSSSSLHKDNAVPSSRLTTPLNDTSTSLDQKDQQIKQLQEALQTEQSINAALQGQKEAITRDLDYFSLTVDELLEEKESLVQKYEEEKLKSQSKEQDLNVLLEKLKASTDSARERSMEVDHWKTQVDNVKEEAVLEQKELKMTLKCKDQEITRLKNELANNKEEIKALSARWDQLVEESNQQRSASNESRSPSHYQSSAIETPSASPRLEAQQYSDGTPLLSDRFTMQKQQLDTTSHQHDYYNINGHQRTHRSTTPPPPPPQQQQQQQQQPLISTLDSELHMLTKEKEKLQSDYGKIPISGGGPLARRRQERLEEMLDEVDSQLSKVKQKIRRS